MFISLITLCSSLRGKQRGGKEKRKLRKNLEIDIDRKWDMKEIKGRDIDKGETRHNLEERNR